MQKYALVKTRNIYCGFSCLKLVVCSIDWSCLRRQRKGEANGRCERAWFRQVLEEYRRRCRIAIAAVVAAAASAACCCAATAAAAAAIASI